MAWGGGGGEAIQIICNGAREKINIIEKSTQGMKEQDIDKYVAVNKVCS